MVGKFGEFTTKTYLAKENLSILRPKIMRIMLSGMHNSSVNVRNEQLQRD